MTPTTTPSSRDCPICWDPMVLDTVQHQGKHSHEVHRTCMQNYAIETHLPVIKENNGIKVFNVPCITCKKDMRVPIDKAGQSSLQKNDKENFAIFGACTIGAVIVISAVIAVDGGIDSIFGGAVGSTLGVGYTVARNARADRADLETAIGAAAISAVFGASVCSALSAHAVDIAAGTFFGAVGVGSIFTAVGGGDVADDIADVATGALVGSALVGALGSSIGALGGALGDFIRTKPR